MYHKDDPDFVYDDEWDGVYPGEEVDENEGWTSIGVWYDKDEKRTWTEDGEIPF